MRKYTYFHILIKAFWNWANYMKDIALLFNTEWQKYCFLNTLYLILILLTYCSSTCKHWLRSWMYLKVIHIKLLLKHLIPVHLHINNFWNDLQFKQHLFPGYKHISNQSHSYVSTRVLNKLFFWYEAAIFNCMVFPQPFASFFANLAFTFMIKLACSW